MSIRDAYLDLKYLLNRGYRKSYAIEFVANHYRLPKRERYILARCVFPDSWVEEVGRKLLKPEDLAGKGIAIDGFNVLITLESAIRGEAILCEDGLVRDVRYVGRYRINEGTGGLLSMLAEYLRSLNLGKAVVFYGSSTPRSGEVKKVTVGAFRERGIPVEVELVGSPDFELKRFDYVATADTAIITRVKGVVDLPALVAVKKGFAINRFLDLLG
jgi:hypothetical protein